MLGTLPSTKVSTILREKESPIPHGPFDRALRRDIYKQVLSYGLPSMGGFLVTAFNELVDMFWLAKIGPEPVAAVTIFMTMFWMLSTLNLVIGVGSVAIISRRFGEKDISKTEQAIKSTFWLKFITGTVIGGIALLFIRPALKFFGAEPAVLELAVTYGVVQLATAGFLSMAFTVYTSFRCIGMPKFTLIMQGTGALVNMIVAPLLIFGVGPFPQLGILGASIAASSAHITVCAVGMFILSRRSSPVPIDWFKKIRPAWDELMYILKIGWPAGINHLSFTLAMSLGVKLVAMYGTETVAIYGAASKVVHFGFMAMVGLSLGTSALVGQFLGSREHHKAWIAGVQSIRTCGWVMVAYGVVVALLSRQIIHLFFELDSMNDLGTDLLRIMALSLPSVGMHIGAETVFEGAGLNTPPMILALIQAWILVVPLMYLLGPGLGYGPHGLMWGWTSAHVLGSIASIWLFRQGAWLKHEV